MTKQLTGWFPGQIKPVHPGVYRRRFRESRSGLYVYALWANGFWRVGDYNPNKAAAERRRSIVQDSPDWCGLANPPKERT